jgi:cyclomaltodextrinase
MSEPAWVRHAVWWQVYPLGFLGAEPVAIHGPPLHRLRRLIDWLDYAIELGTSGLALGPIFASETHGYDTTDHHRIDPRLGDDTDFDTLITAAHHRGLRVLLDGVFNHVGRTHPRFHDTPTWFRPDGNDWATFEGHHHLVTLNHTNPHVTDHIVDVMNHWLDRGADGWRLDAAYAVPRPFWAQVIPRVRATHPDAYLVGEVIHGDYTSFVTDTGIDTLTQYELWKAIWSSLNDTNLHELSWALHRHTELLNTFTPQTFIGNHDVTRIASTLTDHRHLGHALAILLTVGGTPSVYYGDEQAFRGHKEHRAGGDDAIRPTFPDTPHDLAPYGWPTYRLHQHLIGLRRRNPWLHHAHTHPIELANDHAVLETTDGQHRLLLALNLADTPVTLPTEGATTVLAGTAELRDGHATIAAHAWAVLGA